MILYVTEVSSLALSVHLNLISVYKCVFVGCSVVEVAPFPAFDTY